MKLQDLLPELRKGRAATHAALPKHTTIQFDTRYGDWTRVLETSGTENGNVYTFHTTKHVGPQDIPSFDDDAWELLPKTDSNGEVA